MYICKTCRKPIKIHEDEYTGSIWVKCKNHKCDEYGKVLTYIDKKEYKRQAINDKNISD